MRMCQSMSLSVPLSGGGGDSNSKMNNSRDRRFGVLVAADAAGSGSTANNGGARRPAGSWSSASVDRVRHKVSNNNEDQDEEGNDVTTVRGQT